MSQSEPGNLYADTIDPVHRTGPDEVFFIRIEARPTPGAEDFGRDAGAFVNCYINADDLRAAEQRAIALIQAHDWHPVRLDSWHLTCLECASAERNDDLPDAAPPRDLVQQALTDGEACEFYCWPSDAPDANDKVPNLARGHFADTPAVRSKLETMHARPPSLPTGSDSRPSRGFERSEHPRTKAPRIHPADGVTAAATPPMSPNRQAAHPAFWKPNVAP